VVDPANPTVCYCPATATFFPPSTATNTSCTPPLTLCAGTYLCDPSCLTCAGSGPDQCQSCSVSGTSVIYSGQNSFGPCLAPCGAGQYRDPISLTCQSPDCSSLSNCNDEGACTWNGTESVCSCYSNFQGNDFSTPLSCPALSNCSGQGTCALDLTTQSLYCQCVVGGRDPLARINPPLPFHPKQTLNLEARGSQSLHLLDFLQVTL